MKPALTVKSQVTIPKEIRDFLGIGPGERISFEPMADGRVAIASVKPRAGKTQDAFESMRGAAGQSPLSADDVMRITRGEDWNQP